MYRRQIALGIIALSLLAAGTARADSFIDYSSQCFTGSFWTCASVQVFARNTPTGTYVEIRARNLMPGNSVLNTWDIEEPVLGLWGHGREYNYWSPWTGFNVGPHGSVETIGPDPLHFMDWSNGSCLPSVNCLYGHFDFGAGVVGCDNNLPVPVDESTNLPSGFFRTCPAQGYTGWVGLTFQLSKRLTARDFIVNFDGHRYDPPPVSVTPEPGSLVLLATGLAGVAGLRRRRRRLTSAQ